MSNPPTGAARATAGDLLDPVMAVMDAAFDPSFGEAWNRQQVAGALAMPHTWCLLAGPDGGPPGEGEEAVGFALSRGAAGEEELLLIAVHHGYRGRGVGSCLLQRFIAQAQARGADRLFLEMREGNTAAHLYQRHGFRQIGRRRNYYRSRDNRHFDALTLSLETGSAN